MGYDDETSLDVLIGQTFTNIRQGEHGGNDAIFFIKDGVNKYVLYHDQNCCENVSIDDISGDLQDLVGSPITLAEESTSTDNPKEDDGYVDESHTWTFYRFATVKGYVNIKF